MEMLVFLAGVVAVSISGVMMPGPVMALTVAKGHGNPWAGALVGLGHGAVELPLVLLIWLGLGRLLELPALRASVGLVGGTVMVLMGLDMIRKRADLSDGGRALPYGAASGGIILSVANPYFFIWWAAVGTAMVVKASRWGLAGVAVFYVVHWLCDFGWSLLVSVASHRAGRVWSGRAHRVVFASCGLLVAGFGAWFVWGALSGRA